MEAVARLSAVGRKTLQQSSSKASKSGSVTAALCRSVSSTPARLQAPAAANATPAPEAGAPPTISAGSGAVVQLPEDPFRPSPAEVEDFYLKLQSGQIAGNSSRVSMAVQSAVALSRDLDVDSTFPAQIARMLATKSVVQLDDLVNPAQFGNRTYDDLDFDLGLITASELAGEAPAVDAATAATAEPADAGSSGSKASSVEAAADAAFDVSGGSSRGKADATGKPEPATASKATGAGAGTGSGALQPVGLGSINWASLPLSSLGPSVGGPYSYVPSARGPDGQPSGLGPYPLLGEPSSFPATFVPHPAGTLYLTTLASHLDSLATRADGAEGQLGKARDALVASAGDKAKGEGLAQAGAVLATGSQLDGKQSAAVAALAGATVEAFATYVAAYRASGGPGAGSARAKLIREAAGVLRSAATGRPAASTTAAAAKGPAVLPSVGEVAEALYTVVYGKGSFGASTDGPVAGFSGSASAASLMVQDSLARAAQAVVHLNAAAAHASAARVKHTPAMNVDGTSGVVPPPQGSASFVSFALEEGGLPPVAATVAQGAMDVKVLPVAVTVRGPAASSAPVTSAMSVALAPRELELARLAAGHVPSMLAPLSAILTPGEWESVVALVMSARPGGAPVGSLFIPYPVGGPAAASGGAGAGQAPEVAVAGRSVGADGATGLLEAPLTTGQAVDESAASKGGDASTVPVALPASATVSAVNEASAAVGGAATLGPSTTSVTQAASLALANSPNATSAGSYVSLVAGLRVSRSLLTLAKQGAAAHVEGATSTAKAAGLAPETAETLSKLLALRQEAALAGELQVNDESIVAAMRTAETALPIEDRRRLTSLPSELLGQALKACGTGSKAGDALAASVAEVTGASAPGARSGPLAIAAAAAASSSPIVLGSLDYAGPAAAIAGVKTNSSGATTGAVAPSGVLARVGSATPALGAGTALPTAATVTTSPAAVVRDLAPEVSGGLIDLPGAAVAYEFLGMDLFPLPPRVGSGVLARAAQLEVWAGQAVSKTEAEVAGAARDALLKQLGVAPPGAGGSSGSAAAAPSKRRLLLQSETCGTTAGRLEELLRDSGALAALRRAMKGASAGTGSGSGATASTGPVDPSAPAVVRVPKTSLAGQEAAVARDGPLGLLRSPDQAGQTALATAQEGYDAYKASQAEAAALEEAQDAAGIDYRSPQAYAPIHRRLLEALAHKDLGAAWTLWAAHTRLHDPVTDPDVLALEIMMDGCASAGRSDLLHHVLWPRVLAWGVPLTQPMVFALLKSAALCGQGEMAEHLFNLQAERSWPLDGRQYSMVVTAWLGSGLENRGKAYRWFNKMLRAGHPATGPLFSSLLHAVHKDAHSALAGLREWNGQDSAAGHKADDAPRRALLRQLATAARDGHYLWKALSSNPSMPVSLGLHLALVGTLAATGNAADLATVLKRQASRSRIDGYATSPMDSVEAGLLALLGAERHEEAGAVLAVLKDQDYTYTKERVQAWERAVAAAGAANGAAAGAPGTKATGSALADPRAGRLDQDALSQLVDHAFLDGSERQAARKDSAGLPAVGAVGEEAKEARMQ